jgi:hypothetical protein
MLLWVILKNIARKMSITIYQAKKRLLNDYMIQKMKSPNVAFGMK